MLSLHVDQLVFLLFFIIHDSVILGVFDI